MGVEDPEFSSASSVAKSKRNAAGTVRWLIGVLGPFLGLIVVIGLFSFLTRDTGSFLTTYNWRAIAVQTVVVGTAALGMTMIMITGGIDLSVGSAVALVTVVVACLVRDVGMAVPVALICGVLVGGVCGLLNGGLITSLGVVPFIITLGGLKVFRGLAKWFSSSTAVYVPGLSLIHI